MNRVKIRTVGASIGLLVLAAQPGSAWSNRGHRLVNLVAAESLPPEVPAFMRTPEAIAEISYLGPEPDRWRPETAPDLSKAAGPDHFFRVEAGVAIGPLPRRRYDYLRHLDDLRIQDPADAAHLTPQYTGTLPWQAEEIYERLLSAFIDYRIAEGEIPPEQWKDMAPMSKADMPYIEDAALYYAGWMGHYIADGCMPLHASINLAGWAGKDNPHQYTTKGAIHHQFEVVTDDAIEDGKVTPKAIMAYMKPARLVPDPFADTLHYLQEESAYAEQVYIFDKQGAIEDSGTPALDEFIERRMAEGGDMLRNLIYSAWIQSKNATAPDLSLTVTLKPR